MGNYYFVSAALPPLELGKELELSFSELMNLFVLNLSESDYKKVYLIRKMTDLANVLRLLKNEPCDPRGNYSVKELEEALSNKSGLPYYLFEFLDRYEREKGADSPFF